MITDKLADKRCYPLNGNAPRGSQTGLTFRERLIIALASNSSVCRQGETQLTDELAKANAVDVIKQVDAIIEQLGSEKK